MYARARWAINSLLVLLFSVAVAGAQAEGRPVFAQAELDQMLAPIALYPDALLSQVLMAATYPREVAEAARWSRDNPDLNGDRAVRAAERIDWDPSVKSLVAFPQILDMMDAKLGWTEDLGDAFLDQQAQVMDTVQYLRQQAYSAGNLASNDQFRVDYADSSFSISFTNAEMAYVPYYDPLIVYGTWWWPAYRPVYWAPWPGYHARPGYARGYAWGPGIRVSSGFFFGAPDWHRHSVNVVNVNNYYYRSANANRAFDATHNGRAVAGTSNVWQHDAARRHDVPRRDAFVNQGRSAAVNSAAPAAAAPPEMRGAPMHQSNAAVTAPAATRGEPARNAAPRAQDSRGFEGRGEPARRPEARADAVNQSGSRPWDRGSHQQAAGGMSAPAAAVPAASAPAANHAYVHSMPVPTSPPVPASHANAEQQQRPHAPAAAAAPAPDGAGRRNEARPAGREHEGRAAADNNVAAAAPSGNWRGGNAGGNSHRRE